MKFIVACLLTALLGFSGGLYFPWWIIGVAAFVVSVFIPQSPAKAFLSAFIALFLLWGAQSFYIDQLNAHLLSIKIASILPLDGSYVLIIVLSAFIGGLVAGLAGLTGSFLRPAK